MNKSWKTAHGRKAISNPMSYLSVMGKFEGKRVLDFGCGLGQDVDRLRANGFDIYGYDPFHSPEMPEGKFDTITCNYVLNVLTPHERLTVLVHISTLIKKGGSIYISVRRDFTLIQKPQAIKGIQSSKGTWQYYVELPFEVEHEANGSFIMYKARG